MAEKVDQYAQVAYLEVDIPATGALTFSLLQISKFALDVPKLGLKIARLEIDFSDWIASVHAHAGANTLDNCGAGLSVSNLVPDMSYARPEIIAVQNMTSYFGTVVGIDFALDPIVKADFTTFPGGGILIPADRLYLAGQCTNVGAIITLSARMWYTVVPLDAMGYLELIESRSILATD